MQAAAMLRKQRSQLPKYGRLYDWATAVALDASCNSTSCALQITTPHRGICPTGWHIPSDAEWDALMTAVGGLSTAGTKLKATTGWNSDSGVPVGTDAYGFAALPGGDGSSDGHFYVVGNFGYWWSSSQYRAGYAYYRYMDYNYEDVGRYYSSKSNLLSVRCLQD